MWFSPVGFANNFIQPIFKKIFFYCIEAMKYNHEIAKQNIRINKLQKKFKLYNFAVSNKNEILYFDPLKSNSDNTNNLFS